MAWGCRLINSTNKEALLEWLQTQPENWLRDPPFGRDNWAAQCFDRVKDHCGLTLAPGPYQLRDFAR